MFFSVVVTSPICAQNILRALSVFSHALLHLPPSLCSAHCQRLHAEDRQDCRWKLVDVSDREENCLAYQSTRESGDYFKSFQSFPIKLNIKGDLLLRYVGKYARFRNVFEPHFSGSLLTTKSFRILLSGSFMSNLWSSIQKRLYKKQYVSVDLENSWTRYGI